MKARDIIVSFYIFKLQTNVFLDVNFPIIIFQMGEQCDLALDKSTWLNLRFYIRITKLLKKNYLEKFIEELGFVKLSTQAKHLRA